MSVQVLNPINGSPLRRVEGGLCDAHGNIFPVIDGVPRLCSSSNYTENFGFQWNVFDKTQLDHVINGFDLSCRRFYAATRWNPESLQNKSILEVGSGAGRFSRVVLSSTTADLFSIDYSESVVANYKNNSYLAPDRFKLFQASVYQMPFPDNSFDKVFCFGVLQHTPNFEASVEALIKKAKPMGEIVVDFYPIKGWWTKINAKYILRPLLKNIPHLKLLKIIERNIDWLISLSKFLNYINLGFLTRFLPICNIEKSFPKSLSREDLRELAILDTFDQYSPEHDNPQRIKNVVKMFERHGAEVTFSGFEEFGDGMTVCVVRGIKI